MALLELSTLWELLVNFVYTGIMVASWILSFWVIYDAVKDKRMGKLRKAFWAIMALIFGLFAAILYYYTEKR